MSLVAAFAALSVEDQAKLIQLHVGNELFRITMAGMDAPPHEVAVLKAELADLRTNPLVTALPPAEQAGSLGMIAKADSLLDTSTYQED